MPVDMRQASWMVPSDLAPGDHKSQSRDWSNLTLQSVESAAHPAFAVAYQALWNEFGSAGEMERAATLARRLQRNPHSPEAGCTLTYCLQLLMEGDKLVAVRDHTVILREASVVIHLSHNLIEPEYRRTGLAGWLRALPLQSAKSVLKASGVSSDLPITLVAEMEPADDSPKRMARLIAYEKAGFRKIPSLQTPYRQPDFRSTEEIDASGGARTIPLSLVVRRVGQESEDSLKSKEVRNIVESLYLMYGADFRATDMATLFKNLATYPDPTETLALLSPTTREAS